MRRTSEIERAASELALPFSSKETVSLHFTRGRRFLRDLDTSQAFSNTHNVSRFDFLDPTSELDRSRMSFEPISYFDRVVQVNVEFGMKDSSEEERGRRRCRRG